jgi:hypothetical protein
MFLSKRHLLLLAFAGISTIGASFIAHYHWSVEVKSARSFALDNFSNVTESQWQVQLAEVELFHPASDPDELLLEQQRAAKEAKEQLDAELAKRTNIRNGQLVGIKVGEPMVAFVFMPEQVQAFPLALTVGEGWLEHWQIESVKIDRVTWLNSESGERWTQLLFTEQSPTDTK